jgi:dolichol-phosphate mannosyltransferase
MSQNMPFISVVSPVYGCHSCIHQLVSGIEAAFDELGCEGEIILVDDASPDNAWEVIQEVAADHPGVLGIRHSRNFGQHAAIMTGLEQVRGDWVVVMDCDLQDPPSAIPALYRKAADDHLDAVFGQRIDRQDSARKRFSSWAFHRTLSWLTGVNHDGKSANFGIFTRQVIDEVVAMPERTKAFPLMVKWVGFDLGYLPVQHAPRAAGESGYTFGKMIALARSVALSYSDKPLRMVATAGSICSLIAFAFALGTVLLFFQGDIGVAGYTSVMFAVWLLGGLTLFSLGVVGLYVGQVFENVQGRPSSITREVTGDLEGHAGKVRYRTVAYLADDQTRAGRG